VTAIAHPEILDAVSDDLLESSQLRTPPRRRRGIAIALGRFATVGLPLAMVAVVVDPRPALLPLAALALAWYFVLRAARTVPPPAARLGAVGGGAIGVAIALLATMGLIVVFGDSGVDLKDLAVAAPAVFVLSAGFEAWLERRTPPIHVLVVGNHPTESELGKVLLERPNFTWSFEGVEPDGSVASSGNGAARGLEDLVLSERPDLVVLTEWAGRDDALDRLLMVPIPSFRVVSLDHFFEWTLGRVSVWSVSPLWFMSLLHAYARPYRRVTKRILDLSLAGLTLALAWPLMLVIAVLVKRSSPGPVVYRQIRAGEAGAPFEIFKFRTMTDSAEIDGQATWAGEKDPRITGVGRLLRRYRFDELPQIWNVLRGEMSIVGPRPERPEFVALLERDIPHWSRRLLVKPGLTGWAQIRRGYTADPLGAADKLSYDLYYIKHRGVLLDLIIVLKTFGVVLTGNGAR
jgi:exopolysaccharide biosynthesis polyprenyl glycosylphosphotransferase